MKNLQVNRYTCAIVFTRNVQLSGLLTALHLSLLWKSLPLSGSTSVEMVESSFCGDHTSSEKGGVCAIPTGSVPHWLDFKNGDFRESTAFKSYGVKTKRTSQYANKHGLPRPDSARFEHGGGSRSNTKGEYVALVWQKHYLPT